MHFQGFNCVQNMPFFYPTDDTTKERGKIASLELSIMEKLSNDSNKLSFEVIKVFTISGVASPTI